VIKTDTDGDNFEVVKVGEKFVLVQSDVGYVFDGTLPHAGAPVNYEGFMEGELVTKVETLIRGKMANRQTSFPEAFEDVFDGLCKFKEFDKITRFHALIMPNDEDMQHAANNVRATEPISDY
jgi:hypothetical protein